jgi:hypothetical protein
MRTELDRLRGLLDDTRLELAIERSVQPIDIADTPGNNDDSTCREDCLRAQNAQKAAEDALKDLQAKAAKDTQDAQQNLQTTQISLEQARADVSRLQNQAGTAALRTQQEVGAAQRKQERAEREILRALQDVEAEVGGLQRELDMARERLRVCEDDRDVAATDTNPRSGSSDSPDDGDPCAEVREQLRIARRRIVELERGVAETGNLRAALEARLLEAPQDVNGGLSQEDARAALEARLLEAPQGLNGDLSLSNPPIGDLWSSERMPEWVATHEENARLLRERLLGSSIDDPSRSAPDEEENCDEVRRQLREVRADNAELRRRLADFDNVEDTADNAAENLVRRLQARDLGQGDFDAKSWPLGEPLWEKAREEEWKAENEVNREALIARLREQPLSGSPHNANADSTRSAADALRRRLEARDSGHGNLDAGSQRQGPERRANAGQDMAVDEHQGM